MTDSYEIYKMIEKICPIIGMSFNSIDDIKLQYGLDATDDQKQAAQEIISNLPFTIAKIEKTKQIKNEFDSLINIPLFINTHQIIKDKSTIYTCNTAIDCIGVYDLDDEYYAQFNVNFLNDFDVVNMPANADQLDSRHLNSLYDAGDKIYFCRHNKNLVPSDYGVLDKASMQGEIIASAGRSCHGIRIVNNHLYSLSKIGRAHV